MRRLAQQKRQALHAETGKGHMAWRTRNSKLLDVMSELAHSEDKRRAYKRDPHGFLAQTGLSAEERAAILSENQDVLLHILTDRAEAIET